MKIARSLRYGLTVFGWRVRGLKVGRMFRTLMEREFWTAGQWRSYQEDVFLRLVRHCYEHVPLHRERFDACRLHPSDIRSTADLDKIPILTKAVVRANQEKAVARNASVKGRTTGHTTGSTGVPLTIYGDRQRSEYILAGLWRIYARCGWQPGDQIASIWGYRDADYARSPWGHWLRDYVSGTTHLNAFTANDVEFASWAQMLQKSKPTVLVCYGSSGSRFARWLIKNQERVPSIKGVYCTSEKLYEHQARQLEQAFACPVFDLYGCGETLHVACGCRLGSLHINPDMAIVETDEPNADGNTPLVVTGFCNMTMPFLRYVNGDCGSLREGQCDCGRKTPLMNLEIARIADVFRFANGKEFPSLYFVLRLYRAGFEGVELFQFHQDRIDHIYLRIMKNSQFNDQTRDRLEAVKQEIAEHIEQQASVSIEYVDRIEQTSSGKHHYAKSDVR